MEERKARLGVRKAGGTATKGSVSFSATLPNNWIRDMGLGVDNRNLKLIFEDNKIVIVNNEEEVKMLNLILEYTEHDIKEEMNSKGYIDDSDNQDRFLDNSVEENTKIAVLGDNDDIGLYYENEGLIEELKEEALKNIQKYMSKNYKEKGSVNDRGDYTGCYYKNKEGLKNWKKSMEY